MKVTLKVVLIISLLTLTSLGIYHFTDGVNRGEDHLKGRGVISATEYPIQLHSDAEWYNDIMKITVIVRNGLNERAVISLPKDSQNIKVITHSNLIEYKIDGSSLEIEKYEGDVLPDEGIELEVSLTTKKETFVFQAKTSFDFEVARDSEISNKLTMEREHIKEVNETEINEAVPVQGLINAESKGEEDFERAEKSEVGNDLASRKDIEGQQLSETFLPLKDAPFITSWYRGHATQPNSYLQGEYSFSPRWSNQTVYALRDIVTGSLKTEWEPFGARFHSINSQAATSGGRFESIIVKNVGVYDGREVALEISSNVMFQIMGGEGSFLAIMNTAMNQPFFDRVEKIRYSFLDAETLESMEVKGYWNEGPLGGINSGGLQKMANEVSFPGTKIIEVISPPSVTELDYLDGSDLSNLILKGYADRKNGQMKQNFIMLYEGSQFNVDLVHYEELVITLRRFDNVLPIPIRLPEPVVRGSQTDDKFGRVEYMITQSIPNNTLEMSPEEIVVTQKISPKVTPESLDIELRDKNNDVVTNQFTIDVSNEELTIRLNGKENTNNFSNGEIKVIVTGEIDPEKIGRSNITAVDGEGYALILLEEAVVSADGETASSVKSENAKVRWPNTARFNSQQKNLSTGEIVEGDSVLEVVQSHKIEARVEFSVALTAYNSVFEFGLGDSGSLIAGSVKLNGETIGNDRITQNLNDVTVKLPEIIKEKKDYVLTFEIDTKEAPAGETQISFHMTDFDLENNLSHLNQSILPDGVLRLDALEDLMQFEDIELSGNDVVVGRHQNMPVVRAVDTRWYKEPYSINVSLEEELSIKGRNTIPNALFFVDDNGADTVLNSSKMEVFSHVSTLPPSSQAESIDINWEPDKGVLLRMKAEEMVPGSYSGKLNWQLVAGP
ncbi:hypothetical protein [Carnobacterium maltaromaticum]|uniref:hypothetical protein n=1 Tax=Carnobacterium maltaromaticum TaxID=2751 RepID=UPI0012F7E37E|nr:hypothetical protein [Carnobacterium maltaromaticum]